MVPHTVSLTAACMGIGLSLCGSCVYPCVCCLWDSLSPASRHSLHTSISSAWTQPLRAVQVRNSHQTTSYDFTSWVFLLTSLLHTPSSSLSFLPLATGLWLHSSSGASRTTVWHSSLLSPWAHFRLPLIVNLFTRFIALGVPGQLHQLSRLPVHRPLLLRVSWRALCPALDALGHGAVTGVLGVRCLLPCSTVQSVL